MWQSQSKDSKKYELLKKETEVQAKINKEHINY